MATKAAKKVAKPGAKSGTKPAPRGPSAAAEAIVVPRSSAVRASAPNQSKRPTRTKVPFPKKNQPPSDHEFLARLPEAAGKKFDAVRTFLTKEKGVAEDMYFYGPKTGWAYRYLRGAHSLATIMIHDDRLMGIVSLDAAALALVDFGSQSEVGQHARRRAHGSPSLLWLDIPLDGRGATDFKTLLKAKLKSLPPPGPPPPPPRRDVG